MRQLEGYITDVSFDAHFWREMAPSHINFAAAMNGMTAPDAERPFHYVELGCGQGIVTNLLAAAYPHGRFTGIDLNPSHILTAREISREAQLENVSFREESFLESANLSDDQLQQADYIAINSIISWVPPEAFNAILRFIERKLRSGGLVYISYNSMPGWADLHPVRQMLYEYANRCHGRSDHRMRQAISFADRLRASNLGFFQANAGVRARMDEVFANDPHHMVHEYLNDSWRIFYVTQVADALSQARCSHLGAANPLENRPQYFVAEDAFQEIRNAPDPLMAEFLTDLACNQWYRRDLFVRGPRS